MNPARLLRAIAFAADKHRDQRRKDAKASPYINHPIAVATVLAVEGGVSDEAALLAAVLHDTVEDIQTTFAELEEHFGPDVAGLVRELTDNKSLEKAERKRHDWYQSRALPLSEPQVWGIRVRTNPVDCLWPVAVAQYRVVCAAVLAFLQNDPREHVLQVSAYLDYLVHIVFV